MSHRSFAWLAVATVVTLGLVGPFVSGSSDQGVALAKPFTNVKGESIADVTEGVLPSVVSIAVKTNGHVSQGRSGPGGMFRFGPPVPRRGIGSGVIIDKKGYILTNNHVVDGADTIKVKLADGRDALATVVGTDPKSDLAVVRLKKKMRGLKAIPFGSSSRLRLGEVVLAVGNPMGVGQSVTMGIVSAKGRGNMGIVDYEDFIQTDAAINPGNSGGALVNMKGQLVGINTAILSRSGGSQGIGFAIPSDLARPIMRMLIKSGKVTRGYLGVAPQTVDEDLVDSLKLKVPGNSGVLISDVLKGTPAHKAGLRRNDVVIKVNSERVKRASQFRNLISSQGSGTVVSLEVARNGQRIQVPVKLGKLPEDRGVVAKKGAGKSTSFGIQVVPVDRRTRQEYDLPRDLKHGVIVTAVKPGSSADALGLRKGDVILELNRHPVRSAADFKKAYRRSGNKLALLLYRDGMTSYIVITK